MEIRELVEQARAAAEDVDVSILTETLKVRVAEHNVSLAAQGLPSLPHKVTPCWFYQIRNEIGLAPRRTQCAEAQLPDPKEVQKYQEEFRKLVADKDIKPSLCLSHDEFAEYKYKWATGKIVLTTCLEREGAHGPVARVANTTTSLASFTCGLIISPTLGVLAGFLLLVQGRTQELQTTNHRQGVWQPLGDWREQDRLCP